MIKMKVGFSLLTIICSLSFALNTVAHENDSAPPPPPPPGKLPPLIPGMSSIILLQGTPQKNTVYREFYANNVELEPFTLVMCATPITKDGNTTYPKVPASEIRNVRFYTDKMLTLDSQYNPGDIIPVIHNLDADASKNGQEVNFRQPDVGEPDFSVTDASKRRALFIYDESSNYYHLYRKEGFYLGGISSARYNYNMSARSVVKKNPYHVYKAFEESANNCFPNLKPGVGETVVRLYLLATKALQNTPTLNLYALATHFVPEDDSGPSPIAAHNEAIEEGPVTYRIPHAPQLGVNDLQVSQSHPGGKVNNVSNFYSYFSSEYTDNDNSTIQEERGLYVCSYSIGASFHGLYEYSDNRKDPVNKRTCTKVPSIGQADCNEHNCKRRISISAISSKSIPFHDLFSGETVIGKRCPHSSGAFHAGLSIKPLLRSENTVKYDPSDNFYRSLLGGVGAFYYLRKSSHDDVKQQSSGVSGGQPHVFYAYSNEWGISPSPGLDCKYNSALVSSGHDMYGNPVYITFVPAVGASTVSLKDVSS